MKLLKAGILSVAVASFVFPAFSQDVTVETPKKAEAEAAAEREKKIQQEERAKAILEQKPVRVHSGFLVDVARAEKKSKLFSLRTPRDPKTDYRNVSFDERSERPRGFVLWRLEF